MNDVERLKYLRIALVVIGIIFVFCIWPLTMYWPSGWAWHSEGRSYYLEMILSVYATLGVFLILAARNPLENRSLILFTIWSSIAHGGMMAYQAITDNVHIGHLYGDVLALFAVAAVLAYLLPKGNR
jgi:hypothetical protein